jgi:hypothetical protein
MTMYKVIQATENGHKTNEFTLNLISAIDYANHQTNELILVELASDRVIFTKPKGKKFEGLTICCEKYHAFEIETFEGGASFKLGFETKNNIFEVEMHIECNATLLSEIGYTIVGNKLECVEHGKESYISLNDYEPTKEEVKKYIEILKYTYVEL